MLNNTLYVVFNMLFNMLYTICMITQVILHICYVTNTDMLFNMLYSDMVYNMLYSM